MSQDALTPEEATALRDAADGALRGQAQQVQLAASDRHARRHLPLLKEKMALLLSGTKAVVVRQLRRPCQVTSTPPELAGPMAMGEQAQGWIVGAAVRTATDADPVAWLGFPPVLAFHLIEVAFGAPGVISKSWPQRDFLTPLEKETVWPVVEACARAMVRAFGLDVTGQVRISPLPYPVALEGLSEQESGVSFRAQLRLGEDVCEVGFALTPKALDLLHEAAAGEAVGNKLERAATNMLAHLGQSEVQLLANLGTTQLTVRALTELQAGQMIWLDKVKSSPIDVLVEGQLKFTAMPMQRAGAVGVQIVSRVE